ncbi:MAG: mazG, partial [Clostridia bacterium]|nr:mazG [Clostridia bacterium]
MKKIVIIGLGSGDYKQLTLSAIEQLKAADVLIMRTEKHPTVDYIRSLDISFTTCDDIYDTQQTFEDTYSMISERVMKSCKEGETLVYAVPGHPLVAEKSVELLLKNAKEGFQVEIIPAVSFIDSILTALRIDPAYGLKIIDGLSLDVQKPDFNCGNIITQVYSKFVASEIKLKLMELYQDDIEIYMIRAAGVKDLERIEKLPLYEMDRIDWVDYLTSVYIPPVTDGARFKTMDELLNLMDTLRGEEGCPWDRKQTRESLKPYLLEETYEVLDAIEKDDIDLLVEELGDLLLQVVFHAQIAKESGEFDFHDVVSGIVKKLIERHPHVFGDVVATS